MNWSRLRHFPWIDTRARFVASTPSAGTLLDLGTAEGETLGHIHELRPDLKLFAVDKVGPPRKCPPGCKFQQVDLEKENLPWPDRSIDAITCIHLVEHLRDLTLLSSEVYRILKAGGRIYLETPHPKSLIWSSPQGSAAGTFTLNFFDDLTHVRPITIGALGYYLREAGLEVQASGISRNWLFAAAWPIFAFLPSSRRKFTTRLHLFGWSAFLIAHRPLQTRP